MKRAVFAVALAGVGCSGSLPWVRGDLANHPAALVGRWIDVAKSSAGDSSIWILEPNGDDHGMHIVHVGGTGAAPRVSRERYGYWYVRNGAEGENLCVTRRPGRDAPSCTPFVLVIDSGMTPPRKQLRLAWYVGSHHSGERVLVEWR